MIVCGSSESLPFAASLSNEVLIESTAFVHAARFVSIRATFMPEDAIT